MLCFESIYLIYWTQRNWKSHFLINKAICSASLLLLDEAHRNQQTDYVHTVKFLWWSFKTPCRASALSVSLDFLHSTKSGRVKASQTFERRRDGGVNKLFTHSKPEDSSAGSSEFVLGSQHPCQKGSTGRQTAAIHEEGNPLCSSWDHGACLLGAEMHLQFMYCRLILYRDCSSLPLKALIYRTRRENCSHDLFQFFSIFSKWLRIKKRGKKTFFQSWGGGGWYTRPSHI